HRLGFRRRDPIGALSPALHGLEHWHAAPAAARGKVQDRFRRADDSTEYRRGLGALATDSAAGVINHGLVDLVASDRRTKVPEYPAEAHPRVLAHRASVV